MGQHRAEMPQTVMRVGVMRVVVMQTAMPELHPPALPQAVQQELHSAYQER